MIVSWLSVVCERFCWSFGGFWLLWGLMIGFVLGEGLMLEEFKEVVVVMVEFEVGLIIVVFVGELVFDFDFLCEGDWWGVFCFDCFVILWVLVLVICFFIFLIFCCIWLRLFFLWLLLECLGLKFGVEWLLEGILVSGGWFCRIEFLVVFFCNVKGCILGELRFMVVLWLLLLLLLILIRNCCDLFVWLKGFLGVGFCCWVRKLDVMGCFCVIMCGICCGDEFCEVVGYCIFWCIFIEFGWVLIWFFVWFLFGEDFCCFGCFKLLLGCFFCVVFWVLVFLVLCKVFIFL